MIIDNFVSQYTCVPSFVASSAEWIDCWRKVVAHRSVAAPKGGNLSIQNACISAIEKYGGRVEFSAKTESITLEDSIARGVRLKDGSEFRAKVIISNADIKETVLNLVGEKYFPNDYVQGIKNLTYSAPAATLKVCLDEKGIDEDMVIYIPDEFNPTYNICAELKNAAMPEWVGAVC